MKQVKSEQKRWQRWKIVFRFSDETSWFKDDQGGLDGAFHKQGHHEEEALLAPRLQVHHHVQGKRADSTT